jgi:RimJ/RimL family protein N-acetyltransferase
VSGAEAQLRSRADVTLRPVSAEDAPAMLRWMNDPNVAAGIGLRSAPTMEKTLQWVERSAADPSMRARAILLDGAHVGNAVLDRIDDYLSSARLSIYLGESHARGIGVASSAMKLLLAEAFESLHLNKVWLTVHCKNVDAIATYVRLGFSIEGVLRDEFVLNGERINLLYMGLLKSEYARLREGAARGA